MPAGTTFVSGYYDMTGDSEQAASYYVTSFMRGGIESDAGPVLELVAQPRIAPGDVLFSSGFE